MGDAVDPAALFFGRGKSEPELFLQGSREDAAHSMALCQPVTLATSSIVAPSDNCGKSTFLAKFTIVPIPIWLELEKDRPVRPHSGYSPSATATGSFATGTDGSNRSPSASESVVNERQIEFGEMRRGEFDRLPVQDVGGAGDPRSRPPAAGTLKYRESCGACVAGA